MFASTNTQIIVVIWLEFNVVAATALAEFAQLTVVWVFFWANISDWPMSARLESRKTHKSSRRQCMDIWIFYARMWLEPEIKNAHKMRG